MSIKLWKVLTYLNVSYDKYLYCILIIAPNIGHDFNNGKKSFSFVIEDIIEKKGTEKFSPWTLVHYVHAFGWDDKAFK